MRIPLTALQLQCVEWIEDLTADKPWLPVSYVMAHCRIESGWDPKVKSKDFATTGSVGLMQVSSATLQDLGLAATDQEDPQMSLAAGVSYLAWLRAFLMGLWKFQTSILYHPICEAYNIGPGAVAKGVGDPAYYLKWSAAQQGYAFVNKC